jgi:hypothetical protein
MDRSGDPTDVMLIDEVARALKITTEADPTPGTTRRVRPIPATNPVNLRRKFTPVLKK